MDTLKDKQRFDDMESQGQTPWAVWKSEEQSRALSGGPAGETLRRRDRRGAV
jgi:hypothetical protein